MESVNSTQFYEELSNNKLVCAVFSATWCNPCKALTETIGTINSTDTKAKFIKMDIEDNPLAQEFGVRSVPTMKIFKNGELVDSIVGLKSKSELISILNNM